MTRSPTADHNWPTQVKQRVNCTIKRPAQIDRRRRPLLRAELVPADVAACASDDRWIINVPYDARHIAVDETFVARLIESHHWLIERSIDRNARLKRYIDPWCRLACDKRSQPANARRTVVYTDVYIMHPFPPPPSNLCSYSVSSKRKKRTEKCNENHRKRALFTSLPARAGVLIRRKAIALRDKN